MSQTNDPSTNDDPVSLDVVLQDEEKPEENNGDLDQGGEDDLGGSTAALTTDDDTEEAIEQIVGQDVVPGKPFSLAEEIEKNELERHGFDPDDLNDAD